MARGEVKYRVVLDSKDVERGVAHLQLEFKKLGETAAGNLGKLSGVLSAVGPAGALAAAGLGAVTGGAIAVGKAVADAVVQFANWADELETLGQKTGISTEALQSFQFAAKLSGTTVQEISGAVNKLQKAIIDGSKGFDKIGVSAARLKSLAPEDAFLEVAAAIRQLPTATEQAAAAMTLFGKSGATLLPAINNGLTEAAARARELGIVLSSEDVAAAAALQDEMDTLTLSWEGFTNQIGASVIKSGLLQTVIGVLQTNLQGLSKWLRENKGDLEAFLAALGPAVKGILEFNIATSKNALAVVRGAVSVPMRMAGAVRDAGQGIADFTSRIRAGAMFGPQAGKALHALSIPGPDSGGQMGPPVPADLAARQAAAAAAASAASEAAQKRAAEVSKAAARFSGAEAQSQANLLTAAFEAQRTKILENAAGFKELLADMLKAREEGARLTPQMQLLTDVLANLRTKNRPLEGGGLIRDLQLTDVQKLVMGADRSLMGGGQLRELDLAGPAQQTHKLVRETVDWSSALNDVANAFQVLGVKSDSVFGRVLGGLTAGGASLAQFQKLLTVTDATTGKSKFSLRNLGTGGLGSILGQASAAMGIAGAAVSVGKAIAGLFGSSPVEKATKTAGKVLGVKVSEELAQSIVDTAKKHNVSTAIASLLNLSGAITASGKDPRGFSAQVGDLMNAVKLGAAPAREGLAEIGKAFGQIADSALKSGVVGDRALVGLIKRAKELGQEIPEIKAFVGEQLTSAAQGITDLVSGMAPTTEAGAAAQATLFHGVFWATLKEKGLVAAADALGPALKTLEEQLASAGIDMPKGFAEVAGLVNLGQNEQVRGASQAAAGAGAALSGMANAGFLSADMLAATGQIAADAVKQAMAGGASEQQGLQLIAPLLSQLLSASEQSGMALDDQTQMLLKQAQDNGIALLQTPIEQQTRILGEIRDTLRGIAGMGREEGGASVPGAPLGAAVGVAQFQHGSGGVRDFGRGMPALLHGKEAILTEDQMRAMAGGVSVANKPNFVIDGGGRSDDHVVSLIVQALARNDGNIATAVERIIAGKR